MIDLIWRRHKMVPVYLITIKGASLLRLRIKCLCSLCNRRTWNIGAKMNCGTIIAWGEKTLPLSSRVFSSLSRITWRTSIFLTRLPRRKRANIRGGHGNVSKQPKSLMSKNVRRNSFNRPFIYGWAVCLFHLDICRSNSYLSVYTLEFLFAKIYVWCHEDTMW